MHEVLLPADSIFCPALRLSLFDTRLGGRMRPNVGNCRVELKNKCPWSDTYVPPRTINVPPSSQELASREAAAKAQAQAAKLAKGKGKGTPALAESPLELPGIPSGE